MIRVLFLIACLVCVTLADTDEPAQPRKRRRHRASEFVYPYFEISAGGQYSKSKYKTESISHWYHDTDRDEMVYDKDLYYNIYSFEGYGPQFETKVGILLLQRGIFFVDFGLAWSFGDAYYKYYSRDKEEFKESGGQLCPFYGFGTKVYPFVKVVPLLDGFFVGASVSFLVLDNSWDKYDMDYASEEVGYKFEMGNVWSVSEHYFVGITLSTAIYWSGVGSNKEYGDDEFQVNKNSKRDPVDEVNTLQLGAAVTVVRK